MTPPRRRWTLSVGGAVAAVALAAVPVFAQTTAPGTAGKAAGANDGSGASPVDSKFTSACADGAGKYAARDFPAAIAAFQKAIEAAPKNPFGYYLLGEAQLAANNVTEAEAAWTRAALEASEKDVVMRAKILFVMADLKERLKKWDEASVAWQAYLDWAAKYPEVKAFTGSGQSRMSVIEAMQKQEKACVGVRQRIADTKSGTVFNDLSKSAPAAPAPTP